VMLSVRLRVVVKIGRRTVPQKTRKELRGHRDASSAIVGLTSTSAAISTTTTRTVQSVAVHQDHRVSLVRDRAGRVLLTIEANVSSTEDPALTKPV
ncbi:hypothetical protein NL387_26495, partial [Klebsiella pneumoniae]|nr:hypothetical protein [Klebsiella pneumoniae]